MSINDSNIRCSNISPSQIFLSIMKQRAPWLLFLFALLSLLSFSSAATPASFCKCTCFGNSSIIALDAPVELKKPPPKSPDLRERASKKTCNDCNRSFCLSYSFCKGEKEENVVTTCFRMPNDMISRREER
ncbi:unnamed protein product [Periconia digitata]|uniref:Uncharacterized protein n=1 Tax=Periconia digitata TaxID=1303443 RepID=A0A9W4UQW0_9PLEO|nr:unnamed protein product [Periconia digitata]